MHPRLRMNVFLCAERREFKRSGCATECSDHVSITFLTIKEFSLDDSRALLFIIHLKRK